MAGVYVHVPFCHGKCAYCDFYSMAGSSAERREAYAGAVAREWELRTGELGGSAVRTVYFGGGTPSMLPPQSLRRILCAIAGDSPDLAEATLEANPEDVSAENAAAWLEAGFDRVSMGVQSLDDSQLQLVGRRHTSAQATKAVETLRAAGFANISLDLIYGLPGQTPESFRRSLRAVTGMRPEHLSAYLLSYEPHTRLTAMLRAGRIRQATEEEVVEMYGILIEETAAAGYEHYEISNFALPGRRAVHNSSYWDGTPYLGLGPGAHSYDGTARRSNPADLRSYLEAISAGRTACEVEEEAADERFNDMLITALRTSSGLALKSVSPDRLGRLMKDADSWLRSGSLVIDGESLRIPERHWLVADAVMRDLLQ